MAALIPDNALFAASISVVRPDTAFAAESNPAPVELDITPNCTSMETRLFTEDAEVSEITPQSMAA